MYGIYNYKFRISKTYTQITVHRKNMLHQSGYQITDSSTEYSKCDHYVPAFTVKSPHQRCSISIISHGYSEPELSVINLPIVHLDPAQPVGHLQLSGLKQVPPFSQEREHIAVGDTIYCN